MTSLDEKNYIVQNTKNVQQKVKSTSKLDLCSISELSFDGKLKKKKQKGGIIVKEIALLSKIMSTSKGRDKICGIIQYFAKLLYTCQVYSNIEDVKTIVKDPKIVSQLYSKKIYASQSQNRKIFRFLKFFDEIKKLAKIDEDSPFAIRFLETLIHTVNIFYYLFDNILWFMGSSILNTETLKVHGKRVKYMKNVFSQCKCVLVIIRDLLILNKASENESEAKFRLLECGNKSIKQSDGSYYILSRYLESRRHNRYCMNNMCLTGFRFLTLYNQLKLPYSEWFNPIFMAYVGLTSQLMSFLKVLNDKGDKKNGYGDMVDNITMCNDATSANRTSPRNEQQVKTLLKTCSSVRFYDHISGLAKCNPEVELRDNKKEELNIRKGNDLFKSSPIIEKNQLDIQKRSALAKTHSYGYSTLSQWDIEKNYSELKDKKVKFSDWSF